MRISDWSSDVCSSDLVIVVLVAIALGVAGLLIDRSGAGDLIGNVRDAIAGKPDAAAIGLAQADAFDPPCDLSTCPPGQRGGHGSENGSDTTLAVDGHPTPPRPPEGTGPPQHTAPHHNN